ncbi:MAG: helix-turn-helix domain-containing protein, partial [Proteobacteria bacterium]|nr:helix-turn-helix domain-containing protein [Pseudomonadota bacterium]
MRVDQSEIGSPLLGVKQVAELLRVSVHFIYSTMKRHVPHVKVGGALRFRKEDIDRY